MKSLSTPEASPTDPDSAQPRFYDGSTYSKEGSVGFLMKRCLSVLVRNLDVRMQNLDLTGMQWQPLLHVLYGCDTVAACAREAQTDSSSMTRMLDRLEAKGLLTRERSTADRRVVNLTLSPRGQEIAQQIPEVLSEVLNEHLRGFSAQDFGTLMALLNRFLDNGETMAAASNSGPGATPTFGSD
jgi:DNA-binding MarR family transcriptional regulator